MLVVIAVSLLAVLMAPQRSRTPSSADIEGAGRNAAATLEQDSFVGNENRKSAPDKWLYGTGDKKVRGGKIYFAPAMSTNSGNQDPPHDEQTSMAITIRKSPSTGLDVIFKISPWQFMCTSYEGCGGIVSFNSQSLKGVRFIGAADESRDPIVVSNAVPFLAKLRKSTKIVVEKTISQVGAPKFVFDVHGLKGEH